MKAIITRANDDGTFDEVGMSNRFVTEAKTLTTICKRARAYSKGKVCRVECFTPDGFYGKPFYSCVLKGELTT